MFESFKPIIYDHLLKNKNTILKKMSELVKKHPKRIKISLNIYNMLMNIDYPHLENCIVEKYKQI